ncbi:MAG TPA: ABC transporter ATP-binding protein [Gemmatimonadaceae bacterium]|nr:ABC transporter ATP-binding protein [Gemmatimonadaceae bacterium]
MKAASKVYAILTPKERRRSLVLLVLMVIGMVLETLGIGLVIPAIGLFTHEEDLASRYPQLQPALDALGNPTQGRLAVYGVLALVGIYLIKTVFLGFLVWRQTTFSYDVQAALSQRLFTTYLRQPYTFHLQRNSAQLIRNAISEVSQYTFSILLPGLLVLTEGLVLVGITTMLLTIEPLGAGIMGATLGAASWGFYRVTRARVAHWGEARQLHEGMRLQHLQQGLGGAKDVKLLGREEDFLSRYRAHNVEGARVGSLQATLLQFPRLWLEFLGVMGLAILIITLVAQGREVGAIVPALALFAAAAFRLMPSVNRVLGAVQSLRYGVPVIDVLYRELQLDVPASGTHRAIGHPLADRIDVSGVSFCYEGAPAPALRNVSLTIHRGETIGVIGASGAGKSTLVDVILGLLVPTSGEVRVDGEDTRRRLRGWQDQVGYVPQSVYLTDDTVRRNVAFGLADHEIDNASVQRTVRAAQLEEFVSSLPDGLETVVGERGVRLSGGQRQRIGIARALYHDPPVLVLDEATSALDTVTEQGVMQAVAALQGNKTILIVAHRLTTVAQCDRLYLLEHGSIAAEGTPGSMLQPATLRSLSKKPAVPEA